MLNTFISSKLKSINNALPQQKGLSLLEMAIGLVVLGFVALPIIRSYSGDLEKEAYNTTSGSLVETITGINQFFFSDNSRYPCPTDMSLAEGDANFGLEGSCDLASILLCGPTSPWLASGGICKTDNTANAIVIGGVPFGTLKMSQDTQIDFWKNKFIYAVTHSQTKQLSYSTGGGKINVLAADNPLNVANSTEDGVPDVLSIPYDMFLFSTGETGVGGFTSRGMANDVCGDLTTGLEHENCDFDNTFFIAVDPYDNASNAFGRVPGVNFFDDITRMQISPPLATWFQHTDNPTYTDKDYVLTLATKVGIGTKEPDETLHVVGDIRAEVMLSGDGGNLKSDLLCNESGSCFDPVIITDTLPQMNCDSDASFPLQRAVTRVANSEVKCNTALDDSGNPIGGGNNLRVDNSKFGTMDCGGSGEIAQGIDASGDLICVVP